MAAEAMTTLERIRYQADAGLAIIELDRPEKRNALDELTIRELHRALLAAESDDEVRVILLRGRGPAFSAGADLDQLQRITQGAGPLENLRDASELGDLLVLMRKLSKPVIAAIHGQTFAGGAGIATAADLIVARDDITIGYPEVHLGFIPAMVMALLRRICGEKVAFEIIARGDRIRAKEALRLGLVNRVYAAPTFEEDALEYARELAARSPAALALIKRLFYGIDGASIEEAVARGAELNVIARMTEDAQTGVREFLTSRGREP